MRNRTKVVIGSGAVWGLFTFGFVPFSSFILGANDTAPEIATILLYGLTILPACILAIWFMRYAAWWLMILSPMSALGFVYQIAIQHRAADESNWIVLRAICILLIIAAIPGLIGSLLLRDAVIHSTVES
jgi:hypothetical protein